MWLGCILITVVCLAVNVFITTRKFKVKGYTKHRKIEFYLTLVPMIVVCFLIVPTAPLGYAMDRFWKPDFTIKAIGHQWYWEYEVCDQTGPLISFESRNIWWNAMALNTNVDKPLPVPVCHENRLLITSYDVIHSF